MARSSKADPISILPLAGSEIPRAVEIHMKAFPGFFLSSLGPPFLRLLYRFYVQGQTEVALSAMSNGRVVATVIGTSQPANFYRRLVKQHLFAFALASLWPLLKKPAILPRLLKALRYRGDPPLRPGAGALLSSICVDPSFQGTGVGKKLVLEFEAEMWKRGAEFAYLLTDAQDNAAAIGFYEKLGWVSEPEFTTPEGRPMRRYCKIAPRL